MVREENAIENNQVTEIIEKNRQRTQFGSF